MGRQNSKWSLLQQLQDMGNRCSKAAKATSTARTRPMVLFATNTTTRMLYRCVWTSSLLPLTSAMLTYHSNQGDMTVCAGNFATIQPNAKKEHSAHVRSCADRAACVIEVRE